MSVVDAKVVLNSFIKVEFEYSTALVNSMKKVEGRRWNAEGKFWEVPLSSKEQLKEIMGDHLLIFKDEPMEFKSAIKEADLSPESDYNFKLKPYDYQVRGHNAFIQNNRMLLADETGLGKTMQFITAMDRIQARSIILCPATLVYNWVAEVNKHSNAKAIAYEGTKTKRSKLLSTIMTGDWLFIVMSYETYRNDINTFCHVDDEIGIDAICLDEAQKIKNPQSQIGTLIHNIPYRRKYVMTATPFPNNPLESYNYLKFLGVVSENWWSFENKYCDKDGYFLKNYKSMNQLIHLIQSKMLRRTKKEKLKDLPDVSLHLVSVEMGTKQKKLYKDVQEKLLKELQELDKLGDLNHDLTKYLRLQQVTAIPSLVGSDVESAKVLLLDELLENSEGKVILFSHFAEAVKILKERYSKYNPAVVYGGVDNSGRTEEQAIRHLKKLYGNEVSNRADYKYLLEEAMTSDRQREVNKFQENESCRLFIGSSKACREGLTLTAADQVIFLDIESSFDYIYQAFGRAHRIGQLNPVNVRFLICKDTIDEKIYNVVMQKKSLGNVLMAISDLERLIK